MSPGDLPQAGVEALRRCHAGNDQLRKELRAMIAASGTLEAEASITRFLMRPDIRVGLGDGRDIVVHHKHWAFEGRGDNVISAARMAMHMERKALETPKEE